jgi:hypothetical protein
MALGAYVVEFGSPPVFVDDSGLADGCVKGSEQESFWQLLSDSCKAHLLPRDTPAPDPNAPPAAPSGYDPDRDPARPKDRSGGIDNQVQRAMTKRHGEIVPAALDHS